MDVDREPVVPELIEEPFRSPEYVALYVGLASTSSAAASTRCTAAAVAGWRGSSARGPGPLDRVREH